MSASARDSAQSRETGVSAGLVHDYLLVMRGAERSFAAIAESWPEAPIYTTLYSSQGTEGRFDARDVHTSYLQRLRVGQRRFRLLLPLYPRAVERLPVQQHRLILSSSSAFAHGVRPAPGALHVCYCYTPFCYAWHERDTALVEAPPPLRALLSVALERDRLWDLEASRRVTHYIAISELVRQRIARNYDRDASVIHPPVEVERFSPGEARDFFLFVGELVAHKRVRIALEAADRAQRAVKVVGTGPELGRLRADFPHAEFLGRVGDPELAPLYSEARALLVPNVEEFGIAAVEAQAAGRPVVAVGEGGALETVVDGETGILLPRGDVGEFAEALREADFDRFDPQAISQHAARFSTARFRQRLRAKVDELLREAR